MIQDAMIFAGCICILIGVFLWNPIAAWIVGGLMLIGIGVLTGYMK